MFAYHDLPTNSGQSQIVPQNGCSPHVRFMKKGPDIAARATKVLGEDA